MKRLARALWLGVIALLLAAVTVTAAEAGGRQGSGKHSGSHHRSHGHGRIIIGVGPWWGPGWWGWPYYGYPYYPYYYPYYPYYSPPAAPEPSTYIQREPEIQSPPQASWYYCESAGGYYPTVQSCPESWLKVAPRDQ